jgi:hypothetical protein
MNRWLYAVHKWISAAAFAQLAVWTVSGFLFTLIRQSSTESPPVEGAHRGVVDAAPSVPIERVIAVASPTTGPVERVELRAGPAGIFYVARGAEARVRVDARTGVEAPVTPAEAEATASRDQPGSPAVRSTARFDDSPPIDYRECEAGDCPLPVFRVALADAAGTVVYVDATTGDVTARRNDLWRTYDFLWSLHIMDYRGRENHNGWLIRGAALLALSTVLSGMLLLGWRFVRWARRLRAK